MHHLMKFTEFIWFIFIANFWNCEWAWNETLAGKWGACYLIFTKMLPLQWPWFPPLSLSPLWWWKLGWSKKKGKHGHSPYVSSCVWDLMSHLKILPCLLPVCQLLPLPLHETGTEIRCKIYPRLYVTSVSQNSLQVLYQFNELHLVNLSGRRVD